MRLALMGLLLTGLLPGTVQASCPASAYTPDIAGDAPPAPVAQWWHRDVRDARVHPLSAQWLQELGPATRLRADFGGGRDGTGAIRGFPLLMVDPGEMRRPVVFEDWRHSAAVDEDTGEGVPFYPIPHTAIGQPGMIEGGAPGHVDDRARSPRRMLMLDCGTRTFYELAGVRYDAPMREWHARSGMFWSLDQRVGAGLPIVPLLARFEEADADGATDLGHALRMTLRRTNGHVFPAAAAAGKVAGALPLGARLRLKASVDGRDPALRSADPRVRRLLRTLQRHGAVVAGEGPDFALSGTHDARWNDAALDRTFASLQPEDFDVLAIDAPVTTAAVPTLTVGDTSGFEGNPGDVPQGSLSFVVRMSEPSTQTVTFDLATQASTALAGSDFTARTLLGASIGPGALTKTFKVYLTGDTVVERVETVKVNLTNAVNATVVDSQGRGTIRNDDGPAKITIPNASFTEKSSDTMDWVDPYTFSTVLLSHPVDNAVRTNARGESITAIVGEDVHEVRSTARWDAGECCTGALIMVIDPDDFPEPSETFHAVLYDNVGAFVDNRQGVITIVDNDAHRIPMTVGPASVAEGDGPSTELHVPITLAEPAASDVTFRIEDIAESGVGKAHAGTDYVDRNVELTIPAGQTTTTFTLVVLGDVTVEPNESIRLDVDQVTGAYVTTPQPIRAWILNDDGPTLSVGDASVAEGQSGTKALVFPVRLSQAAAGPVTFSIATDTTSGTATAGSDYVHRSLATGTIPAGSLLLKFAVAINGDATVEADESLYVDLANASGASILDSRAIGTITNDD